MLYDFGNSTTIEHYQNMFFINNYTGWVSFGDHLIGGDRYYIYKTTDGGNNWILKHEGVYNLGGFLYFVNKDTGYSYGGILHGKIYKTTDGGSNWSLKFESSSNGQEFTSMVSSKDNPNILL